MTTSPELLSTSWIERTPLRVRLDNGFASGPLDGAWWPQSRDLQLESADLVDHLPGLIGRIGRVLFSAPDWDLAHGKHRRTQRVTVHQGHVEMRSVRGDDTHVMILEMVSGEQIRLLVIPCETDPALARQLMEQAADDRNTKSPHTILGLT